MVHVYSIFYDTVCFYDTIFCFGFTLGLLIRWKKSSSKDIVSEEKNDINVRTRSQKRKANDKSKQKSKKKRKGLDSENMDFTGF